MSATVASLPSLRRRDVDQPSPENTSVQIAWLVQCDAILHWLSGILLHFNDVASPLATCGGGKEGHVEEAAVIGGSHRPELGRSSTGRNLASQ